MEAYIQLAYLIGAIAFILGLRGLSDPRTARRGNLTAAFGMTLAIIASLIYPMESVPNNYLWIGGALFIGAFIGWISAQRVQMTAMPQLVSIFNGLGGGSAMLLAILEFLKLLDQEEVVLNGYSLTIAFTLGVGAISFSGSLLAYFKLAGTIRDKHVLLPGHQWINLILLLATLGTLGYALWVPSTLTILLAAGVSLIYGWSFVAPIGGADMPVVISLLNSVTGLSAATAGFLYDNQIMILGGILVGASGIILTLLMVRAMNRSLSNVIVGGFSASAKGSTNDPNAGKSVQEASSADVGILLNYASKVVIVPGYGLAVARAQGLIKELEELLMKQDIEVYYGIHPVAGRMPGHMNVLLAEVDIDYDRLLGVDKCNNEIKEADVVLVIGANDVVNPAALEDPASSIYGMPILQAWNGKNVIVFKRSMNTGYAGIQNPLFFKDNTKMHFGDASKTLKDIITEIENLN